MSIRVHKIGQLQPAELQRWSDLQRAQSEFHNPFFRAEFAQKVDEVAGNVEVAVFESGNQITGFFPFQREANGVGRPVAGILADMHGIIGTPGGTLDAAKLVQACGLRVWTFDHLVASQSLFAPYHEAWDASPYMDLKDGFDTYCRERKAAGSCVIRRADQRRRKLAKEIGPIRLEWHTESEAAWDFIWQWKQVQVRQHHFPDIFETRFVRLLLEAMRGLRSESLECLISALYAGDQLVAVQFGLRSFDVLSACVPTFNPQLAKYSPGILHHLEVARQAPEHGVRRIELGRGLNQTKSSLMSGSVTLALGAVDRRPLPTLMRKAWYRLRDVVYATPLQRAPLRWFRRIRNQFVGGGT